MTLPLIIYRSLRQHALSTLVTAGSIALAAGLLMVVWMVKDQSQKAFLETSTGFDAVLGARGSKLQLVLNSIFHLE
ncbi:MAG TPA: ABC transporter permease, partial [Opitutaceae bacterium]|nr:ABC transporter permease [Opitutaceae bacterium]